MPVGLSPLFTQIKETGFVYFYSETTPQLLELIGDYGRALANDFLNSKPRLTAVPPYFCKFLLDQEADATIEDLWDVYPGEAEKLQKTMSDVRSGEAINIYFSIATSQCTTPLVDQGLELAVTEGNLPEYEAAYCNFFLKRPWLP
eukprot:CAMPEP_0170513144 /NCGR_PEP_ID=MMETSP0208-20121228/67237_1 /TAXON_ID=197538 /ORGANISM="Strombidium inclinatum, Strain S3" /LENGTH=144 /DNA_ID=CAMNT_0010796845 /DNA_START=1247 /DNA_END=1681 /DNA_ORIENTATION=-